MDITTRLKIISILSFLSFLFLFVLQLFYFIHIYRHSRTQPGRDFDLVVTYSDLTSMEPALALARSHHKPLYVSQAPWEENPFPHLAETDTTQINMDLTSATTDQNARRAANFIIAGGYKVIVLDVDWFHVPRALFLTRLYLLGSGVKVIPCSKTGLPTHWWTKRLFLNELYKFWGSMGRVVLAFFGKETGPKGAPTFFKK